MNSTEVSWATRRRVRRICEILACSALSAGLLAWPTTSSAQDTAEPTDPISIWLWSTCEVGEEGAAAAELAALGATAVPVLLAAANSGPDDDVLADRRLSLAETYAEQQEFLAEGGTPGSDPADIAALQSQSLGEFIADDLSRFTSNYRVRAVQGLAVVGGPQAVTALRSIESSSTDPELRQAAEDALAAISDAPQESSCAGGEQATTSFSCADLRLVMSSVGRKATQSSPLCRVDTNKDGIINGIDMAYVLKRLPAGTRCK